MILRVVLLYFTAFGVPVGVPTPSEAPGASSGNLIKSVLNAFNF